MLKASQPDAAKSKSRRKNREVGEVKTELLPMEALTSSVLDEIFPRDRPRGVGAMPRARASVELGGRHTSVTPADVTELETLAVEGVRHDEDDSATQASRHHTRVSVLGGSISAALPASFAPASPMTPIQDFRMQVLDKFLDVKYAFETFSSEFPDKNLNDGLTKKEWRRVLTKHGFFWASESDRDAILDTLDIAGDGFVSCAALSLALEAAAPLRTLEDLRRRWLASNYGSMMRPINILDDGGVSTHRRQNLKDFTDMMSHVRVSDPAEAFAVFSLVCGRAADKCTIGELAAALATVSPNMLLEDLRERILKAGGHRLSATGTLKKAFADISNNKVYQMREKEWRARAPKLFQMSETAAMKAFRSIDIDESGEITEYEFVVSLLLSEPDVFLEGLRRKIRQRFRSIKQALEGQFVDSTEDDPLGTIKLSKHDISDLLRRTEINEEESDTLFEMVDANKTGSTTVTDFMTAIYFFTPSLVLEDLRLQILLTHPNVYEAFNEKHCPVQDRQQLLDYEAFVKMLTDMDLVTAETRTLAIFDLLDVKHDGFTSVGRLIAALQIGGPGSAPKLPQEERDLRAKLDAKMTWDPFMKKAAELKRQVRQGTQVDDCQPAGGQEWSVPGSPRCQAEGLRAAEHRPSSSAAAVRGHASSPAGGSHRLQTSGLSVRCKSQERQLRGTMVRGGRGSPDKASAADAWLGLSEEAAKGGGVKSAVAPRLRTTPADQLAPYVENLAFRVYDPKKTSQVSVSGAQNSWGNVYGQLRKSPPGARPEERVRIEKELHGYFDSATYKLSHDVPLLQDMHGYLELYNKTRAHHEALRPPKALKAKGVLLRG